MNTADFFYTYPGMFVTQSFLHALIAMVLVDMAIQAWKIDNPFVRQRFRYAVILIAVLSFPLYQLLDPGRGSVFFRSSALFDSGRWLALELFGLVSLRVPFLALLALASLVFLFQELLPVLRHTFEPSDVDVEKGGAADETLVAEALARLPGPKPAVVVLDDDDMVLFSSSGKNASVYISTGILRSLTPEQVQAALAHEAAHIARNRRPMLIAVFILRMLLFFNPVALIEFRRAVRNEEKICDDIAVSRTGDPRALAETLGKFYSREEDPRPDGTRMPSPLLVSLEEYGHNLQLEGRIARLEQGLSGKPGSTWFPFVLVLVTAAVINYFVV